MQFSLICLTVFVLARVLVLVVVSCCISYATNLVLWLQNFNKLTYSLTYLLTYLAPFPNDKISTNLLTHLLTYLLTLLHFLMTKFQ